MPFANLEHPKGVRKRHGILGAKEARGRQTRRRQARLTPATPPPASRPAPPAVTPHLRSQRVTAADLDRGQIRIPRGASKAVFPSERTDLTVEVRGIRLPPGGTRASARPSAPASCGSGGSPLSSSPRTRS